MTVNVVAGDTAFEFIFKLKLSNSIGEYFACLEDAQTGQTTKREHKIKLLKCACVRDSFRVIFHLSLLLFIETEKTHFFLNSTKTKNQLAAILI